MPHAPLAPLPTFRAVVTGSKKPFRYLEIGAVPALLLRFTEVQCRLGISATDTCNNIFITDFIRAATLFGENYTGLTFINRTFVTFRDFFTPSFELRRAPISVINSIKYKDDNGVIQTVPNTVYDITQTQYQRVFLRPEQSWPSDVAQEPEAIEIEFVAGFGNGLNSVPSDIRCRNPKTTLDLSKPQ